MSITVIAELRLGAPASRRQVAASPVEKNAGETPALPVRV